MFKPTRFDNEKTTPYDERPNVNGFKSNNTGNGKKYPASGNKSVNGLVQGRESKQNTRGGGKGYDRSTVKLENGTSSRSDDKKPPKKGTGS